MFAGFDPSQSRKPFFERYRGTALTGAVFFHLVVGILVVWFEVNRESTQTLEADLEEPTIENLVNDEELAVEEEEPEPEPDPQPEKPKPRQEIQNVTKLTEKVVESDIAPTREPIVETPPKVEAKPPPKPVESKPKLNKKVEPSTDIGDPKKPRAMPANGTPPQPDKSNHAPTYPENLRKQNIAGMIKVKLNIHMDGSVRGMKVLNKSISGTEDPKQQELAKKLFLKAVVVAVKTWRFKPAKLQGKNIAVWWPVVIPFSLN